MTSDTADLPVTAIIGGGVSGAGVAFHLARAGLFKPGHVVVFEPRAKLGAGLAYDTSDPAHRINVPAARMSLLPEDQEHFQRWLEAEAALAGDGEVRSVDGHLFPRRRLFGDYVNAMVKPFVDGGLVDHVAERVAIVERLDGRWRISTTSGRQMQADILVIATSHPPPTPPQPLTAVLKEHPRFVADPTRPDALDQIRPNDRVLIVGNGLTSADVIASLTQRGHVGPISAISRRGLRSRGHARAPQEPFGDFLSCPALTALGLLRHIRLVIREAEAEGLTWHAVIDQVRAQGQELWQALPVAERRRLVRHLRPYWDVHRFRVAPQVEDVSEAAIRAGRLDALAASVEMVKVRGDGEVSCVLRLSRTDKRLEKLFDAVVVTTGPGHHGILQSQPWIAELAEQGYLALDPTGLGLACDAASRALGPSGDITPSLFISGPLARGTFGELMGLPQVAEHAVLVAAQVVAQVQKDSEVRSLDSDVA
jgi:uncharacterized NAD(P)/FAD-binding protein YdhS